ncbi:MAG: hypothetical protein HQL56_06915 [Magnetococcales bacterium]|nr:hypothetical protein [Magnetococcales bacterium]
MPFNPDGTWKPEEDSVAKNMTGLLGVGSPYLTQAKQRGLAAANSRGLMNSSMGVQAGESAAIQAALPIAQQDASQTAAKNLSFQDFGQQQHISTQKFDQDTKLADQGYKHQAGLLDIGYQHNAALKKQDAADTMSLEQFKVGADTALKEKALAAEQNKTTLQSVATFEKNYADSYNAIMANTNLDAPTRQQQINDISNIRAKDIQIANLFSGVQMTW